MSRFGKKIRSKLLHIVETKVSKEELLQMVDHRLSVNQQFEHIQSDVSAQALMRAVESRVEEKKLCSRYLMTKEETRDSIIRYTAINMLNKKVFVFGNIAAVTRDEKKTVKIAGWLLPRCNYDKVQVWAGEYYLGDATLAKPNKGAYEKYPMFNDENAGFIFTKKWCFVTGDITLKIYKEGELVEQLCREVTEVQKEAEPSMTREERLAQLQQATTMEDKVTAYQELYKAEQFDAKLMQQYCDLIAQIEDPVTRYWLGVQDLPWILFFYPECAYDEYYVKHRELVNRTIEELYQGMLTSETPVEKRVAITVSGLVDNNFASAIFRIKVAQMLLERGYDVKVFVSDLAVTCNDTLQLQPLRTVKNSSDMYSEYHYAELTEDRVFYNMGDSIRERITNYIDAIDAFRPEYILDISWEHALALPVLQKKYKVIQASISGFVTSMMVDRFITYDLKQCQIVNDRYHSIDISNVLESPLLVDYDKKEIKGYLRGDYSLPEDKFIMVTVGNRMQYELTEDFFENTVDFLSKNEDFIWIIVGKDLNPSIVQKYEEMFAARQIIFWGFENNLSSFYAMCDVYVDPNRQGGGGSVIMAMKQGMPVVMTDQWRDVSPIIKRENCVAGDYQDVYAEVKHLASDREYYNAVSDKMKRLVSRDEVQLKHYVDVVEQGFASIEK